MVWKHNGRTIQTGRAWVSDDNKKYGAGWNNLTDAEKKSAGLVWEDDPVVETFDNRFYWAKGVERKLEDENVVDVDGKAVIDPTTGKQSVEKGTAIASATSTYRDKVRTACNTIETKINDCSKLSDFIALFDVPLDSDGNPTGKAAMYDFPDEE
jgi:hypothetical protein